LQGSDELEEENFGPSQVSKSHAILDTNRSQKDSDLEVKVASKVS